MMKHQDQPRRRAAAAARLAAAAVLLTLGSAAASAATLQLDASGKLLGARGVVVGGTSYDVSFGDGSCIALMGGCDANADFAFNTQQAVFAASQALLAQVFEAFPTYDADPRLTRGCEFSAVFWQGSLQGTCQIITAYTLLLPTQPGATLQVATHMMNNDARDFYDVTGKVNDNIVVNPDTTLTGTSWPGSTTTWAVWSRAATTPGGTVPEPGTLPLAVLAAVGLVGLRRRARRVEAAGGH